MPQRSSDQKQTSILPDGLRALTREVAERPKAALWFVVILACAAAGWTLTTIDFRTERADLIDPDADFQKRWVGYTESFGDSSELVVVVESELPEQVTRVLDDLGRRMEQEPAFFRNVLYKLEAGKLPSHKGLQYLSPQQLRAGLRQVDVMRPYLTPQGERLALHSQFNDWSRRFDAAASGAGKQEMSRLIAESDHFTGSLLHSFNHPGEFRSPWAPVIPGGTQAAEKLQTGYFVNKSGTMGFLKAFPATEPENFDGASQSIDRLRELIAEVKSEHAGAKIGITGIPVLENDEMRRSRSDMMRASGLSFAGVGLLLILGFRGFRHPALALAMLAIGMAWAFGFTTLVVGHLNILSISFAVILIGLGIDYAIHFLARYLEYRHEGDELMPALSKTSASVGAGIVTAAVTTAFAFFSATFTQFLGVAELGIIAGGGILLCAAATFLVLPALISLSDRGVEPKKLPTPFRATLLRRTTARFPRPVALLSLILIAGLGSQVLEFHDGQIRFRVRYDYNLLNLQADGLESVETQKRIFHNAEHSLLYAVSVADSPSQARELKAKFERLPTVDHVDELATALPAADPKASKPLIQSYRTRLADVSDQPPVPPLAEPAQIGRSIEQFYLRIRRLRAPTAQNVAARLDRFLNEFERLSLKQQRAFIDGFQRRSAAALHGQLFALASASNAEPVTLDDLPAALVSRYVSGDGKWLLQVYPKQQIWDVEPLQQFVTDVRRVDPNITGTPLQNFEASLQIKTSYKTASIYALAVIVLVLLIDFLRRDYTLLTLLFPLGVILFTVMAMKTRRLEIDPVLLVIIYAVMCLAIAAIFDFRNLRDAILAMLPALCGGVMMFGALGFLGVNLNPANLIALPLVLGIGVDDGVHIVHDFRSQDRGAYRTSASTMNAIVLTSLTSMIGFGSLMIAAHRGLYTVGLVLVIGVGSCLFVSLVTLPAILTLLSRTGDAVTISDSRDSAPGRPLDNSPTPLQNAA